MKSSPSRKIKNILKEVWEDFKDPMSHHSGSSTCCSYGSPYSGNSLRPEPIGVKDKPHNKINKNSTL
jgi:hypothetical protein